MIDSLTTMQLLWILAGGVCYTAGTPFYAWKSRRYTHAVWHLFVLAGVACHFVAVLSVVRMR
jgi:hemolysin III